ncbi:hypothetical protein AVEN_26439-1, partial [Araneus ventricosus]
QQQNWNCLANYFSCHRKRSHHKKETSLTSETGAASGKTETLNELVLSLWFSASGRVRWRLNTRFQRHHFTSILVEVDALSRPPQDSPSSLQLEMGKRERTRLPDRVVVDDTGDDREGRLSVVGSDKMWAGLRRSIEIHFFCTPI